MRKFLSIVFTTFVISASAQTFYFPKAYYADSLALSKNMPELARQVAAVYKETDKQTYFDNLFRYQLTATAYAESLATLDSFRALLKAADSVTVNGIGFQFQTYAAAKIRQADRQLNFVDAFNISFTRLYNALPEAAAVTASGYFAADIQSLQTNLDKLLTGRNGRDSILLKDAMALCRAYNSYNVYSQVLPLAQPLLTEQDNRQFFIEDSVLIKTRDGATIAATVVRKKDAPARIPAVFIFNIYNSPRDKAMAKEAAIKGFACVVANTRGKRLSPQTIEPFEHDASDAYDIIDWISKQPWSNGKAGMFGGSYLGFSQWAAVKKLHPALKTIVPQVAVGIGIDYPMQNNVFMSYMLQWIHYVPNSKETDQADFSNFRHWDSVYTHWYASGKPFRSLDTIEKRPNTIFQRWLMHPAHDAYWQQMVAYKNDFAAINIPVLSITGYFDDDQLGAMYYFNQHHQYNPQALHYLLIGPYDHYGAQGLPAAVVSGYAIDSVANLSITNLVYQWFNYILKDSARPALLKDKINYEVMGANEWKHASSLAAMNNDTIGFYLSNTRLAEYYKLESKKTAPAEFIRQEVDFKYRSDSAYNPPANVLDSVMDMMNGISFISAALSKDFEINGSLTAQLKASINKKDMDIGLTLYELLPDGKKLLLSHALARASYAKNRSLRQLLKPGSIETIPITQFFFVSRKIKAGNKLALVVSINKNRNWQINYGTGGDVSDESIADAAQPLQIKWYTDSFIKIPVKR